MSLIELNSAEIFLTKNSYPRISRILSGFDVTSRVRKSERETQIKFSILLKPMKNVNFRTLTNFQDKSYQNRKENNVFML